MRTSAFFDAKNFGFFEIYGVSARIRGVEPVRTFFGQGGRGSSFHDFVRTSFIDDPKEKMQIEKWFYVMLLEQPHSAANFKTYFQTFHIIICNLNSCNV